MGEVKVCTGGGMNHAQPLILGNMCSCMIGPSKAYLPRLMRNRLCGTPGALALLLATSFLGYEKSPILPGNGV